MFATNLQQLRRQHQLSQSQLSEILKVSRQMISKYETGQAEPDFTKLIVLADYFNITVDALIGHTPLTITEQPRTDGKILIRSEITTELTSCYKFWVSPVYGNSHGPQALLFGVNDYSQFWGNAYVQLGWYENIAAAKRELTAIEAALIKRQSHYDLQFTAPETSKQPLKSWSATLTKWRHRLHAKK